MRLAYRSFVGLCALSAGLGCSEKKAAPPPPAAPPPAAPGSQPAGPGSQPGSASSLPSEHSTSTQAVDLEGLFAPPEGGDRVVATVGDHEITRDALAQQLRQRQMQLMATGLPPGITRQQVLQGAIDELVDQQVREILAEQMGVTADPKAVQAWLTDIEKRMKAQPSFRAFLLQAGKDAEQRKKDAVRAVLMDGIVDKVKVLVKADTEAEARAYYEAHKKEFFEHGGVEAWRIFIKAPRGMVQRDRDIARGKAEDLRKKAKAAPDNFENLAISYSQGGKGSDGGYVGFVAKGTLDPRLEEQIFAAKKDAILPVWEDAAGFYVYKIGRSRAPRQATFEDVADFIMDKVYRKTISEKIDEKLSALRDAQKIDVRLPELSEG